MVCAFLCLVYEILLYPHVIKVSYTFFSVLKCSVFKWPRIILVYRMTPESTFIFFHMDVQLSQFHILNLFTTVMYHCHIYANVSRSFLFFVSGVFVYRILALLCFTYSRLIGLSFLSSTFRLVLAMSISGYLHLQICFRKVEVLFRFCWN